MAIGVGVGVIVGEGTGVGGMVAATGTLASTPSDSG